MSEKKPDFVFTVETGAEHKGNIDFLQYNVSKIHPFSKTLDIFGLFGVKANEHTQHPLHSEVGIKWTLNGETATIGVGANNEYLDSAYGIIGINIPAPEDDYSTVDMTARVAPKKLHVSAGYSLHDPYETTIVRLGTGSTFLSKGERADKDTMKNMNVETKLSQAIQGLGDAIFSISGRAEWDDLYSKPEYTGRVRVDIPFGR